MAFASTWVLPTNAAELAMFLVEHTRAGRLCPASRDEYVKELAASLDWAPSRVAAAVDNAIGAQRNV